MSSFAIAGIVIAVVGAVVTIVVVVLIIRCVKDAKLPIVSFNTPPITYSYPLEPPTPAIQKDVAGGDTVVRFIDGIAKEKSIRFSLQELAYFTRNYSTMLGSGGTYHINLVRLYGFCYDPEVKALVYEYMDNGSLDEYLFDGDHRTSINWSKLYDIAIGTAKGISYLHEDCQQRITHYDIKPGNVLLDANFCPKVADFGLAKLCDRNATHVSLINGIRGTLGYAAPEFAYPTYPVTHKCDVYSFGILLFEILGRRKSLDLRETETSKQWLPRWAWDSFAKGDLDQMIDELQVDAEEKERATRMCKIALWCIQYVPDDRPSMSFVVRLLAGETEIDDPSFPFPHLYGVGNSKPLMLPSWMERSRSSSTTSGKSGKSSQFSETTPMMRNWI